VTRFITLNEIAPETAGWWLNLNAAHFGQAPEHPRAGTVEDWVFINTSKVNPGYYTIVRARIDLPSGVRAPQAYVYHCHIVEHEDNDMMQSFIVLR
jgi:FtsP/CotA-like multicopper oxidase with cupredoxin domain